jgi:hypothetical protein
MAHAQHGMRIAVPDFQKPSQIVLGGKQIFWHGHTCGFDFD